MSKLLRNQTLLLSFLLHMMLLSSMVLVWLPATYPEKPPSMYVPSYAYHEPQSQPMPAAAASTPAPATTAAATQQTKLKPQKLPVADKGEIALSKAAQLSNASQARTSTSSKVSDAINLVGDKKTVPKPLIKLLARALAAKLKYPKIAVDFQIRGTAYVGFILHPDGTLAQVEVVQSSEAGVLDNEAVRAISAMSPIAGVSQYVDKPKPMVVGIIFR